MSDRKSWLVIIAFWAPILWYYIGTFAADDQDFTKEVWRSRQAYSAEAAEIGLRECEEALSPEDYEELRERFDDLKRSDRFGYSDDELFESFYHTKGTSAKKQRRYEERLGRAALRRRTADTYCEILSDTLSQVWWSKRWQYPERAEFYEAYPALADLAELRVLLSRLFGLVDVEWETLHFPGTDFAVHRSPPPVKPRQKDYRLVKARIGELMQKLKQRGSPDDPYENPPVLVMHMAP